MTSPNHRPIIKICMDTLTLYNPEPSNREILDMVKETQKTIKETQQLATEAQKTAKQTQEMAKETQATLQDLMETINNFATRVQVEFTGVRSDIAGINERLDKVEIHLDKVETHLGKIDSTIATRLVTKDYLDDKLGDLKSDLIILIRKEDAKLVTTINTLAKRKALTTTDKRHLLTLEPFPQR